MTSDDVRMPTKPMPWVAAALALLLLVEPPASRADFQAGVAAADAGDYETAMLEWIPLAIDGVASAQYNVALLYLNALGVEQDSWEALTWLWQAAEQGHAGAQYTLGILYAHGVDMPIDSVQAFAWYSLAARSGHALAAVSRDGVLDHLSGEDRLVAEALAEELWNRYGLR